MARLELLAGLLPGAVHGRSTVLVVEVPVLVPIAGGIDIEVESLLSCTYNGKALSRPGVGVKSMVLMRFFCAPPRLCERVGFFEKMGSLAEMVREPYIID